MTEYLREMADVPRFAAAAHRPARRRLWESEKHSPVARLLIGDAIGDAFGFGIEMQDAYWIRSAIQRFDEWPHNPVLAEDWRRNVLDAGASNCCTSHRHSDSVAAPTQNVRGFYSDDAEMTVGLMKGLVQHGAGIDRDGMMRAWLDEWEVAKRRPPPALKGEGRQGHGGSAPLWGLSPELAEHWPT